MSLYFEVLQDDQVFVTNLDVFITHKNLLVLLPLSDASLSIELSCAVSPHKYYKNIETD